MTGSREIERGSSRVERYVQHVVQALTVAAIIGGVVLASDLRTSNAVIYTELAALKDRMNEFSKSISDRYSGADARRDLTPLINDIADHEARLRALERKGRAPD